MRKFLVLLMLLVVSACQTQADLIAQKQREVDQMITTYGPACGRLGYQKDTDQWRDCILRLNTNDTLARYTTRPTTTTCFGHRGFFDCSTF